MPGCPHYETGRCRSCDQMDVPPDARLERMEDAVRSLFGRAPEPTFRGTEWGFRDKVKINVSGGSADPVLGLQLPDLSGGLELMDCPVQAPALNAELPLLRDFIRQWDLRPYDPRARTGELKGLILSWSPRTGEKMLRFVLRSREALDRIRKGLPELSRFTVVSANLQPIPHALLEGPEEILLAGARIAHDTDTVRLLHGPQGFMQTNSVVADGLYATAAAWAAPWKGHRALDLFCGAGGFALHLARAGLETQGVEVNAGAVETAREAACANGLEVRFTAAPAEKMRALWETWSPEFVVVNPPRRGLGETLPLCLDMLPSALLYSSCDISSLERDYATLQTHYVAARAKIFDMFNFTSHFETLVLLVRR